MATVSISRAPASILLPGAACSEEWRCRADVIFAIGFGTKLEINSFEFWFVMQIAMMAGFLTSYPANWGLITRGLKERM